MKPRRIFTSVALFFASSIANAQDIEFKFQLFRVDPVVAEALHERLVSGGEAAAVAMEKMPEFVRQNRAEKKAELSMKTKSGQRIKQSSSQKLIKLDDEGWTAPDGIEVELDPVFSETNGRVDVNIHATFAEESKPSPRIRRLTTQFMAVPGDSLPLALWQEAESKENPLVLIVTVSVPGMDPGAEKSGQFFVDFAVFETDRDLRANRNAAARVIFPVRSGQRARAESFTVGGENLQIGLSAEVDPVLKADGSGVTGAAAATFSGPAGQRNPNFHIGKSMGFDAVFGDPISEEMETSDAAGTPAGKLGWVTSIEFLAGGK